MSERLIVFPQKVGGGRTYLWEYPSYVFTVNNTYGGNSGNGTIYIENGYFVFGNTKGASFAITTVDLTNFSKLVIRAKGGAPNSGIDSALFFNISNTNYNTAILRKYFAPTEKEYTVDVSSLTGKYYFFFDQSAWSGANKMYVKYMYFE